MTNLYGAIDLGGTNLRAIVADLDANVRGDDRRPSRAEQGLDACLDTIVASITQACAEAGLSPSNLAGVGLASPGWVDVEAGVVPAAPQLPGWRDVPIVRILRQRLGCDLVLLENDANAGALGENVYGTGKGARHMVYITVSTGIGGGIIIDGRLYGGAKGSAGEIGHTVIDPDGARCGCGSHGCLEALASGTAIARMGEAAASSGRSPRLAELAREHGEIRAELVAAAARGGDAASIEIYSEAGRYLGIAVANLVNLLSPEVILLGGGVTNGASDLFRPQTEQTMRALALSEPLRHMRLGIAELGDMVGVLGMIARLRQAAGVRLTHN